MIGSNLKGGYSVLRDPTKRGLRNLPIGTRRVQRRVKDDQVSSYAMRVHASPNRRVLDEELFHNRDADPGEFEISTLDSSVARTVVDMVRRSPMRVANSLTTRYMDNQMMEVATVLLSHCVKSGKHEELREVLSTLPPQAIDAILPRLSRATWRHMIRTSSVDLIAQSGVKDIRLIGELSLNANTLYRRGVDVLRLITPRLDQVLDEIDYVTLGDQQLFNINKVNVVPSGVYPIDKGGFGMVKVGLSCSGHKWVHSPPSREDDTFKKVQEAFGSGTVSIRPHGFLPKMNSKFNVTSVGLQYRNTMIPAADISRILSGFILSNGTKHMTIYPRLGQHTLNSHQSTIRKSIVEATSKNPLSLISTMRERGMSGYGHREIDMYNEGQYHWYRGKRSKGTIDHIMSSVFPHPLIRLISFLYRDDSTTYNVESSDPVEELCALTVATLPVITTN